MMTDTQLFEYLYFSPKTIKNKLVNHFEILANTNVSNFNHLFRAHLGTTPSDYRSRFKTSPLTPDTTN